MSEYKNDEQRERANKKSREERAFYLAHGICPVCRRADVVGNLKACGACLEKGTLYQIKFWANRDRNAYHRELRQRHIADGVCVQCGKNKPKDGCVTCTECLKKNRQRNRRYEREHHIRNIKPDGICKWCDKPVVPGKKFCQEHYPKMRQAGLNMLEHVKDNWFVKSGTIYPGRRNSDRNEV